MGYVWTQEQIESYESCYREVAYHFSGLSVTFTTTPEFVRSVLPPCLEPTAEPKGVVGFSYGREFYNGLPSVADEESVGAVYLCATRDGLEGLYSLTVIVGGDMNVTTGRESWGMPKKRGDSAIVCDGEQIYGFSERRGARLMEVAARLGSEIEPFDEDGALFEIKGWLRPDGRGLQHDPILIVFDTHSSYKRARRAEATLKLTGTIEDPVGDIPVISADEAIFVEGVETFTFREEHTLGDRDAYRPYVYGRNYDNWMERIAAARDAVTAPAGSGHQVRI